MQWLPPDTESRKGQLEGARALLILTPTKLSPTPKAELAGMECFVTTEKTKLLLLRLIHVPVFRLPPLLCCHSCILLTNDPEPLQPILLLPGRCLPRRDAEAAQGYIVSARASKAGSEDQVKCQSRLPCNTLRHSPSPPLFLQSETESRAPGPTLRGSIVMTMPFGLLKRASKQLHGSVFR